ncbi:MAG TPA: hypothetical protein VGG74_36960 [Kofleriaceae bacterium]
MRGLALGHPITQHLVTWIGGDRIAKPRRHQAGRLLLDRDHAIHRVSRGERELVPERQFVFAREMAPCVSFRVDRIGAYQIDRLRTRVER